MGRSGTKRKKKKKEDKNDLYLGILPFSCCLKGLSKVLSQFASRVLGEVLAVSPLLWQLHAAHDTHTARTQPARCRNGVRNMGYRGTDISVGSGPVPCVVQSYPVSKGATSFVKSGASPGAGSGGQVDVCTITPH
jgi:hypothetical protein